MQAADNPTLESVKADPTLIATAFRKNRFYLFTKRDATDTRSADADRDVFNEKPSKEDIIAATEAGGKIFFLFLLLLIFFFKMYFDIHINFL